MIDKDATTSTFRPRKSPTSCDVSGDNLVIPVAETLDRATAVASVGEFLADGMPSTRAMWLHRGQPVDRSDVALSRWS